MLRHRGVIDTVLSFLALGIIGVFLIGRFVGLDVVPPGFFVDESSIGLNAYTLATRGTDEFGARFPLFFKAFGDYKNPLYVYSVAPLIWMFGPHVWSVRLASALWGVAALVVLFFLMKAGHSKREVMLITLALTVSSPWLTHLSRVAFEVASTPFFILLAAYFLHRTLHSQKQGVDVRVLLCSFGLSLGLLFYSYTSARFLSPFLLGAGVFLIGKKWGWSKAGWAIGAWVLCLLPLVFSQTVMDGALSARYEVVGLSRYIETPGQFIVTALKNYASHFTPDFLFHGDGNLRHTAVPYGLFYYSALPLIMYGISHGVWRKKNPLAQWSLFGLLISPIPSSLTIQSPHAVRSIGLLAFSLIFTWLAVKAWASTQNTRLYVLGVVVITACFIESSVFASFYSTKFAASAGPWFDQNTVQLIRRRFEAPGPYSFPDTYYPGTEASIYFFAAEKKIDESQIYIYTPSPYPVR